MISRRLVRIKAMQTYYSFLQDSGEVSTGKIWRELEHNINQSFELYIHMHCLVIAIADFAADRIEISRNKHIPSETDLNPNTKFINNVVIKTFRENSKISEYMNKTHYNWSESPEFIKKLWFQVKESEYYNNYMESSKNSVKEDFQIVSKIISKTITGNKELDEILEDKNIFWNDDLEFLLSNIIQNTKKLDEENIEDFHLPHLYKNASDEKFAKELVVRAVMNKDKFDEIILGTLKKWELERIAFMDRVILHLALCEMTELPDMPVKVTINEYLDIAKFYSTDKSSIFINGILDKVYYKLKNEDQLNKKGLGLV